MAYREDKVVLNYNPNAPRMGKSAFSTRVITKESFARFLEENPTYKEEGLTWVEFYKDWQDIAQTIREEVTTNPLGVHMTNNNGDLKTQYLPYKYKAIDYPMSIQHNKPIQHLNIGTKGKVAKIKWERRNAVRGNKMLQFYGFEPDKQIKELAKKFILANPEKVRVSRNTLGGKRAWR